MLETNGPLFFLVLLVSFLMAVDLGLYVKDAIRAYYEGNEREHKTLLAYIFFSDVSMFEKPRNTNDKE